MVAPFLASGYGVTTFSRARSRPIESSERIGSAHQHPLFAPWAQADLAVVSAGAGNRFGHPAPDTLQAWIDTGARVVRTDQSGDVAIVTSGDGSLGFATRRDMLGSS